MSAVRSSPPARPGWRRAPGPDPAPEFSWAGSRACGIMQAMRDNSRPRQAAGFLLGLVEKDTAARIRARTGLPPAESPDAVLLRLGRMKRQRGVLARHLGRAEAHVVHERRGIGVGAVDLDRDGVTAVLS